jgi:hypothetical protein
MKVERAPSGYAEFSQRAATASLLGASVMAIVARRSAEFRLVGF